MAAPDQQWDDGTLALNGADGDNGPTIAAKYNAHVHQTTDVQAALDGAASPSGANVFATMADVGGGGGLTLKTATVITSNLPGDGSSLSNGDIDITLTDGHQAVIVQAFMRRTAGTGNTQASLMAFNSAALRISDSFGDGNAVIGDATGTVTLDAAGPPGAWFHGPYTTGSAEMKFTVPTHDADSTNKIFLRARNRTFGSTPADDMTIEVRIVYYETPITLT